MEVARVPNIRPPRNRYHVLKTWPEYFWQIRAGNKSFEVRKADRDFQVGDMLILKEFDPIIQEFTLNIIYRIVSYILPGGQFGIEPGYVVMGLLPDAHGE